MGFLTAQRSSNEATRFTLQTKRSLAVKAKFDDFATKLCRADGVRVENFLFEIL